MKIAYIMRGVPGSGKSTVARHLIGGGGVIHSTDDFFVVHGVYRFNPEKLCEYHDLNYRAFCESIAAGVEVVVCDNVNVQPRHYERYARSAEEAGYIITFVVMPHPDPRVAAERSVHNVPEYVIRRLIRDWED